MSRWLTRLRCIDRFGASAQFDVYEVQEADDIALRSFRIVCAGVQLDYMAETFLFVLKLEAPRTAFYFAANHHDNDSVRGKGIPDALLPFLKAELDMNIRSSVGLAQDEWRTEPATKYWRRLESRGLARYDEQRDIFWLL